MREIKFRGLDYYGKWQYGNYTRKFLPSRDWTGKKISQPDWVHYITDYEYGLIAVKPETVGQYTGLKDKNGNEIYEGYILKGYCNGNLTGIRNVKFGHGAFIVESNNPDGYLCLGDLVESLSWSLEVIGNIHENRELFESEDEE